MGLRARPLAESAVVYGLRLLPSRLRFPAVLILATCGASVFELFVVRRLAHRMGSAREYFLTYLMEVLDSRGVPYDIPLDATGVDVLVRAASERRGTLVVTAHTNAGLSRIVVRPLHDARVPSAVVSSGATYPIAGTGVSAPTVQPGATSLLSVRTHLRAGTVVCAMIDLIARPPESEAVEVATSHDSFFVADSLLLVAVRWQVPVAFLRASLQGWRVRLEIRLAREHASAEEVAREFAEFTSPGA